jgi:outer membrane protein assembly factor BamD
MGLFFIFLIIIIHQIKKSMKYYLISALFLAVLLTGCSSTLDTSNFSPDERLKYAIKLYDEKSYEEAVNEFQTIVLQYPGSKIVDDAQYYLGMTRYKRKEYILAAFEFSKLIKNMPASEFVPTSQYMLADCYYLLSPMYSLDQKYTKKSIEEFQSFVDFFPTNEKVAEAEKKIVLLNEKLAEKAYNSAYIYEKLEYYIAATMYCDVVIDTYHDTKFAPLAMNKKIYILIERKKTGDAVEEIDKFLEKYPNDSNVETLKKLKTTLTTQTVTTKD